MFYFSTYEWVDKYTVNFRGSQYFQQSLKPSMRATESCRRPFQHFCSMYVLLPVTQIVVN